LLLLGSILINCQICQIIKVPTIVITWKYICSIFYLKARDVMMNVRGFLFPPQGSQLSWRHLRPHHLPKLCPIKTQINNELYNDESIFLWLIKSITLRRNVLPDIIVTSQTMRWHDVMKLSRKICLNVHY
jgi:hypothetical protein